MRTLTLRRATLCTALACLLACHPRSAEVEAPSTPTLILARITLRDPGAEGPAGANPVTVVIKGDRIARILDPHETVPAGARTIDASGLYLIPGLWDLHTHLSLTGDMFSRLLVAHGVTAVRDLGGNVEQLEALRARIESGELLGPRIVRAGPTLNGAPNAAHHRVIATPEEAATAVAELKAAGMDLLKTHNATDREVYFALLEAAAQQGMKLAGHIPKGVDPIEACRAGQYSVEHIATIFEGTYISRFAGDLEAIQAMPTWLATEADELIDCFVEYQTLFVPTLRTYRVRARWAAWTDDPDPLLDLLGEDVRNSWLEGAAPTEKDRNPKVIELRDSLVTVGQELVRRLHEAGAPIGAGTDFSGPGVLPGKDLHRELELFVEAGLLPREALLTATRGPGGEAGGDARQGRLVEGAPADLVLLRRDPFESVEALGEIEAVVLRGRLIERREIDGIFEGHE